MGVGFPGDRVEGAWAACPQEGEGGWGMRVRAGARCSQGFDNLPDLGDTGEREIQASTSTSPGGTLPLSSSLLGHRVLTNQFQHGAAYLENIYCVQSQASHSCDIHS